MSRLGRDISDPGSFVFTPLVEKEAFDEDALDLRLGSRFLLPRIPPEPFTNPDLRAHGLSVHVPFGSYLVVPAHQTVLGVSLEFMKMPYDVCGQILTKSSIARTFMVIETAPWVHPYYRGCLTLEIANVSNTPLLLYPGRFIGQLVLLKVAGARIAKKMSGTYLAPTSPEAPLFKGLRKELGALGIDRYKKWAICDVLCNQCSKQNLREAVFCAFCGKHLNVS